MHSVYVSQNFSLQQEHEGIYFNSIIVHQSLLRVRQWTTGVNLSEKSLPSLIKEGNKGRFSINIVNIINKIGLKYIKSLFHSPHA
jgi:hypothetical protein